MWVGSKERTGCSVTQHLQDHQPTYRGLLTLWCQRPDTDPNPQLLTLWAKTWMGKSRKFCYRQKVSVQDENQKLIQNQTQSEPMVFLAELTTLCHRTSPQLWFWWARALCNLWPSLHAGCCMKHGSDWGCPTSGVAVWFSPRNGFLLLQKQNGLITGNRIS